MAVRGSGMMREKSYKQDGLDVKHKDVPTGHVLAACLWDLITRMNTFVMIVLCKLGVFVPRRICS